MIQKLQNLHAVSGTRTDLQCDQAGLFSGSPHPPLQKDMGHVVCHSSMKSDDEQEQVIYLLRHSIMDA